MQLSLLKCLGLTQKLYLFRRTSYVILWLSNSEFAQVSAVQQRQAPALHTVAARALQLAFSVRSKGLSSDGQYPAVYIHPAKFICFL